MGEEALFFSLRFGRNIWFAKTSGRARDLAEYFRGFCRVFLVYFCLELKEAHMEEPVIDTV